MRIVILLLAIICFSCSVEPEPLVYGKDQCYSCKMTLMDSKFGAELVTTKGKVYKFDDINCLFHFYNGSAVDTSDYRYIMVADFTKTDRLIDAKKARYLQSPEIKSPMASQTAAFEQTSANLITQWNAKELGWTDLQTQFRK